VFVAIGLVCVWAEIGRPLRAMNVLFHARRSWMTREAIVAPFLFVAGAIAAYTGETAYAWLAAALAFAFVYCQARILRAAKGIPAWRDPRLTPFIVTTSLAEGAGLFWVCAMHHRAGTSTLLVALGALVVLRLVAWLVYRRSLGRKAAAPAIAALDRAGRVLQWAGTLLPLALVTFVASDLAGEIATLPLAALAGLAAVVSGAWVKATLVLRAGFNQGFALPHMPVRGARP
jgi:phenylacetyl-CoA:acceptor oxidoreductase subunit 2